MGGRYTRRRRRSRSRLWRKKYPPRGYPLACLRVRDETFVKEGKSATFANVESRKGRCRRLVQSRGATLPF
jgi:hypothetical protein